MLTDPGRRPDDCPPLLPDSHRHAGLPASEGLNRDQAHTGGYPSARTSDDSRHEGAVRDAELISAVHAAGTGEVHAQGGPIAELRIARLQPGVHQVHRHAGSVAAGCVTVVKGQ